MATTTRKNTAIHFAAGHEDWCDGFMDDACNCSPAIVSGRVPAPSNEETLQTAMLAYGKAWTKKNKMMAQAVTMAGRTTHLARRQ